MVNFKALLSVASFLSASSVFAQSQGSWGPLLQWNSNPSLRTWPQDLVGIHVIAMRPAAGSNYMRQLVFGLKVNTQPQGTRIAPPGDYMLTIVDSQGVPSMSKFINLGN